MVYRLVRDGRLEAAEADGQPVRISAVSLARYQTEQRPPGAQLAPASAWAVLALASGDAAFRAHMASRLSDPDRSRAKTRLAERGFLTPSLVVNHQEGTPRSSFRPQSTGFGYISIRVHHRSNRMVVGVGARSASVDLEA